MKTYSMKGRLFVADLIQRVREIRNSHTTMKEKLRQLDLIARRIHWEHTDCVAKVEKAQRLGRRARLRSLVRLRDLLERGMRFVTATAKRMASKDAGQMGFDYDPCYLAHPSWDRNSGPPPRGAL